MAKIVISHVLSHIDGLGNLDSKTRTNDLSPHEESLLAIKDKPTGALDLINISSNVKLEDSNFYNKLDDSTIKTLAEKTSDFTDYVLQKYNLTNEVRPVVERTLIQTENGTLSVKLKLKIRLYKESSNPSFRQIKSEIVEEQEIPIGYSIHDKSGQHQLIPDPITTRFNNPLNLVNKSTKGEAYGGVYRNAVAQASKHFSGNPRQMNELTGDPGFFNYSTVADLLKLDITKRNFEMQSTASATSQMMNNPKFVINRNLIVLEKNKYTTESMLAQPADTLSIIHSNKDGRATVVLAQILLNSELPKFCQFKKMEDSYKYYINGLNLIKTQKYKKCVIYTDDITFIKSQLATLTMDDFNPGTIDDAKNILCAHCGNREDIIFTDQLLMNYRNWLDIKNKSNANIMLPVQAYPMAIGFFESKNQIKSQVVQRSELFKILLDNVCYRTKNTCENIYMTIFMKKHFQDTKMTKINGQQNNLLKKHLVDFYSKPFAYIEHLSKSCAMAIFDCFLNTNQIKIDLSKTPFKIVKLEDDTKGSNFSFELKGNQYLMSDYFPMHKITSIGFTALEGVALFTEKAGNRTLANQYDIDELMDLFTSGISKLTTYKFPLNTKVLSAKVKPQYFEIISANNGIKFSYYVTESQYDDVDVNGITQKVLSYGPQILTTNNVPEIIILDNHNVDYVYNDLYSRIKSAKALDLLNAYSGNWLLSIAQLIVTNQIVYSAKYDPEDGCYYLVFRGQKPEIVDMLNKAFKRVKLSGPDIEPETGNDNPKPDNGGGDGGDSGDDAEGGDFNLNDSKPFELKRPEPRVKRELADYGREYQPYGLSNKDSKIIKDAPITVNKYTVVVKAVSEGVLNHVVENKVEEIPISDPTDDGNCVIKSIMAILPRKILRDQEKVDEIKKSFTRYQNGVVINRTTPGLVKNFFYKQPISVKVITINDEIEKITIASFGNIMTDKLLIFRYNEKGILHCKPYKIKNIDELSRDVWCNIVYNDLFRYYNKSYNIISNKKEFDTEWLNFIYNKDIVITL